MKKPKLKYNQEIHAKITRIYDEQNKEYHFMRNETKIVFENGNKLLGSVLMTNPGSFDFKYDPEWDSFKNGDGFDEFESTKGTPDPTMINIIKAVLEAYSQNYGNTPDGYIRIYNLSSVRCPNGEEALKKHSRVKQLLMDKDGDISILEDPIIYNEEKFIDLCIKSKFIILGFLRDVLTQEANRLNQWSNIHSKSKKVIAPDLKGNPYHPIVWIKLNGGKPFKDIVTSLKEII